ncbi:hypothetical protein Gotur_011331 [Gossypium turneri]
MVMFTLCLVSLLQLLNCKVYWTVYFSFRNKVTMRLLFNQIILKM